MTNKEYVSILDVYFEKIETKKGIYFKISDEELVKLCHKVRTLEFEKKQILNRHKKVYKSLTNKIEELKNKVHVYKIELGRNRRKLSRIYTKVYTIALIGYINGITDSEPKELVDFIKHT